MRQIPTIWANHNRVMPPDSPEPGPYRASRTPYMIPPMAAAVSFLYRGIGICCGTQMGKTASLFNLGGERIDNDPAPFLWIGPTKSNIDSVIVPQWDSMIEGCASLKLKMAHGRQKALMKRIATTTVRFAWSGSATEIASQPAAVVVVDEVDKCENLPGHGSVLKQAEGRISNYRHSGGILVATSTPTEGSVEPEAHPETGLEHWAVSDPAEIASEMWKLWQQGTRHEFMVPCPECGGYFSPRLRYLTGWDQGATPAKAKRQAKLMHWKCGALIDEKHKHAMLQLGRAVAPGQRVVDGEVIGTMPDSEWYTIWISGLLSPWVTWSDSAYQWVEAARSHDQAVIQATINLRFGELFRLKGEAPPWEDILKISKDSLYSLGVVPDGVRMMFLSVDVQKDHLVIVARGWGVELESWLILREDLWGDTADQAVWDRLAALVDKGIGDTPYTAVLIDSGFRTEQVYTFCETRLGMAFATKGKDRPSKLYSAGDVEVLRSGKKVKRGLKVWTFDHAYFKGWVHDRIRHPQDQIGAWHLPTAIGDDYCRQLVAEQRMRLPSGQQQFVKSGVNDYLDAEALQVLGAYLMGVRDLRPVDSPMPPVRGRGVRSGGVQL